MNQSERHFPVVDERTLMRLVDGELSVEEQQIVLQSLECEDGGWRRCALAFLEDQALADELGLAEGGLVKPGPAKCGVTESTLDGELTSTRSVAPGSTSVDWLKVLSMAAVIIVAFTIGSRIPLWPSLAEPSPQNIVDADRIGTAGIDSVPTTVSRTSTPFVQTPYVVNDSDFWERGTVVTPDLRDSLRRMGADVHAERGIMPVRLEDGRELRIPYEDVQIVPVNRSH